MKYYPGPMPWLEEAAKTIDHRPGDVHRAVNLDGFSTFSDLIGQSTLQKDFKVGLEQRVAAMAALAPVRIALAAADRIFEDTLPLVLSARPGKKAKAAP